MRPHFSAEYKEAFTLLELLIVIAIIGILAAIILPFLQPAREKARDARRLSDLHQISAAVELYALDNSNTPPGDDGVEYINGDPQWIPGLVPKYITSLPSDPLDENDHKYHYMRQGVNYEVAAFKEVHRTDTSCGNPSGCAYIEERGKGDFLTIYNPGASGWNFTATTTESAPPPATTTPPTPSPPSSPPATTTTITGPAPQPKLCASYIRTPTLPTRMVAGSWQDTSNLSESSPAACLAWAEASLFNKPYCAQPSGTDYLTLLFIDQNGHSFDMPTVGDEKVVAHTSCTASGSTGLVLVTTTSSTGLTTSYGGDPSVVTLMASNVGDTTVTFNGEINPQGASYSEGSFRFGTTRPTVCSINFGRGAPFLEG